MSLGFDTDFMTCIVICGALCERLQDTNLRRFMHVF